MPLIASEPPLYSPSTFSYQFEPLKERVCLPLSSWSVSEGSEPSWSYWAVLACCIWSW